MKFTTLVALVATTSANQNPDKIVDGAAFEAFQKQMLQAERDAKKFIHDDVKPNLKQYMKDQKALDEELYREYLAYEKESNQTWDEFVSRAKAAKYDQKLGNIEAKLDKALGQLE